MYNLWYAAEGTVRLAMKLREMTCVQLGERVVYNQVEKIEMGDGQNYPFPFTVFLHRAAVQIVRVLRFPEFLE